MQDVYINDIGFVSEATACNILCDWVSSMEDMWEMEDYKGYTFLNLRVEHLKKSLRAIWRFSTECRDADPDLHHRAALIVYEVPSVDSARSNGTKML